MASEVDPAPDAGPGEAEEEEAVRLPRGRLFSRLALADLIRIGMFGTALVAIVVLREPCADGIANFVGVFDEPAAEAEPASQELELRRLSDEEIRELFPSDSAAGGDDEPVEAAPPADLPPHDR